MTKVTINRNWKSSRSEGKYTNTKTLDMDIETAKAIQQHNKELFDNSYYGRVLSRQRNFIGPSL